MTANVQEAVLSNSTVGRNDRGSAEKKYMEPPEVELDEGKAANYPFGVRNVRLS